MQAETLDSSAEGASSATNAYQDIRSASLPVDPFLAIEQGMGAAYNVVSTIRTCNLALVALEGVYGFDPALKPLVADIQSVLLVAATTLSDALEIIDGGECARLAERGA